MILGLSTATFTFVHVLLSLVGIASGFVVLAGLLTGKRRDRSSRIPYLFMVLRATCLCRLFGNGPARCSDQAPAIRLLLPGRQVALGGVDERQPLRTVVEQDAQQVGLGLVTTSRRCVDVLPQGGGNPLASDRASNSSTPPLSSSCPRVRSNGAHPPVMRPNGFWRFGRGHSLSSRSSAQSKVRKSGGA